MTVTTTPHPPAPAAIPMLSSVQYCLQLDQERLNHPLLAVPSHLLCGYRSKVCASLRVRKRNGSLHRFCEHHRQRANSNQKKWVKRRLQSIHAYESERLAPYEVHSPTSYQALLASARSEADSESVRGTNTFRDEELHGGRFFSDLLHSSAVYDGDMDDGDLLWEALGLSALEGGMEFTF